MEFISKFNRLMRKSVSSGSCKQHWIHHPFLTVVQQPTDDPAFFWSEEEQLYFHTGSGHYYDAVSEQYYNPETKEWYTEE